MQEAPGIASGTFLSNSLTTLSLVDVVSIQQSSPIMAGGCLILGVVYTLNQMGIDAIIGVLIGVAAGAILGWIIAHSHDQKSSRELKSRADQLSEQLDARTSEVMRLQNLVMRFQEAAQHGYVRFKRDEEGNIQSLIHEIETVGRAVAGSSAEGHGDAVKTSVQIQSWKVGPPEE